MKLYTRTGDSGETSLFDGTRVSKHDERVDAYGEVDELNAWLGLARASGLDADLDGDLVQIQRDLFALGAQLADPADKLAPRITKAVIGDADARGWSRRSTGWRPRCRRCGTSCSPADRAPAPRCMSRAP